MTGNNKTQNNMKKSMLILAGTALLLAACAKEQPSSPEVNPGDQPLEGKIEFSATLEGTTRTALDGTRVNWVKNDAIDILWEGGSTTAQASQSGASANFTATISSAAILYAVYPRGVATLGEEDLQVTIPATQTGSFASANIAVARTSSRSLAFKNLCGLLKFTISRDDVAKIVVKGQNNEVVCGTGTVSFGTSGTPAFTGATGKSVTLDGIAGAGTYYLALAPGAVLSSGIHIEYFNAAGLSIGNILSSSPLTVTRSNINNLGNLDEHIQVEWFVTPTGAGRKDGQDWANALSTDELVSAISYREDPDERNAAALRYNGATFWLAEGTYTPSATIDIQYPEMENVVKMTFKGGYKVGDETTNPTGGATVFSGAGERRLMQVGTGVNLDFSKVTFSDCKAASGGGGAIQAKALSVSSLSFDNCTFSSNDAAASNGGALYATACKKLRFSDCSFSGNSARYGGALNVNGSVLEIDGSTFTGNNSGSNTGASYGGALFLENCTSVTISGASRFTSNSLSAASSSGGAVNIKGTGGEYLIQGTTDQPVSFASNMATNFGSAIYVAGAVHLEVRNAEFVSNTGTNGGAVCFNNSTSVNDFIGCTFTGNYSTATGKRGGALTTLDGSVATLNVSNCQFNGNHADQGGAIGTMDGGKVTLKISGSTFSQNYAAIGGAMYLYGNTGDAGLQTVTVTDSNFDKNWSTSTSTQAGAIYVRNSTLKINGGSFTDNGPISGGSTYTKMGGAIYVTVADTQLHLDGVTFSGNRAERGGAIATGTAASLVRANQCVFTGNKGDQFGGAVGTSDNSSASLFFNNCVFNANQLGSAENSGTCIYVKGGILGLNNCSVYGNTSAGNVASDADFNFSNSTANTGVIVMNTTVVKSEGFASCVSFRIPTAFSSENHNIQLLNNVVLNHNATGGSGVSAAAIKSLGYNFMTAGNSTFDANVQSTDQTFAKAQVATLLSDTFTFEDYYYKWNGVKTKDSISPSALKTAVSALSIGSVSFGSDFIAWLEGLTVRGGKNALLYDIAGNTRSTTALWSGCYEKQ